MTNEWSVVRGFMVRHVSAVFNVSAERELSFLGSCALGDSLFLSAYNRFKEVS